MILNLLTIVLTLAGLFFFLATTVGILFDKGQIIQGEATENVAVLAKIKSDMSPEEMMDAVLKMREIHQVDKDRTKKK